jgi:hypothetical protein
MSEDQDNTPIEEWRDLTPEVLGWPIRPGYQVSCFGRVRSRWIMGHTKMNDEWKILDGKPEPKEGYQVFGFRKLDGREKKERVHKLVALAFLGKPPVDIKRPEVRHLDGNPQNSKADNLKWGTPAENTADKIQHGRLLRGEEVGNSKFTNEQIKQVAEELKAGVRQCVIVRKFNMSAALVCLISNGKLWSWLTGIPPAKQV